MQLHQVVLDGEVEKALGGVLVQLVVPVHVPGGGGDENGVLVVVFVFAVIGQGLCPCLVLCPVCSFLLHLPREARQCWNLLLSPNSLSNGVVIRQNKVNEKESLAHHARAFFSKFFVRFVFFSLP